MKQSTCGAVFCQPGGDELKHENTYLASKVKDWEPLTTSEFIGSPLLVPWTCTVSTHLVTFFILKGIYIEILMNSIFK